MEKKEVKKCKKTLNILQIAATDKENLSSKIHRKKMSMKTSKISCAKRNKKNEELDNKTETQFQNNINKNKTEQSTKLIPVTESDLTVDNPSENYWQKLAESCRKALESALKENVDLHNKVNELEYENGRLKAMLSEAKSLVEVLTEMVEEDNNETNDTTQEDSVLNETKESDSDSDPEDMSFQSCL